ncbi:MAG TPA: DUF2167 domain-containing protein [Opitutaceae bacterium]|nr:DUF2167 domain-containing protein [Opitutaceae bacterium]
MKKSLIASTLLAFALVVPLRSADAPTPADDRAAQVAAAQKLVDGLKFQQGEIVLRGGVAKIALPAGFRYLDAAGTETVLSKIWGNPRGGGTLGMITPANFDALGGESWAVVLTFDEDGYVKDDDAAKINYESLLKDMKKDTSAASKARVRDGYSPIELVGWAAVPRYDAATHKMYWAKELKFGDSAEHTLNYNIRMLGRRGVLVLNAVAGMGQLKEVEAATPELLRMVDFQDGHRYADFTQGTDKTATYGLAALVAGGIGAKVGLFKGLWLGILAFKKFILIGVIALGAWLKKIFEGRKEAARLRSGETGSTLRENPPSS